MTDRDDALRRELGWTGPEGAEFEPEVPPVHDQPVRGVDTGPIPGQRPAPPPWRSRPARTWP